MLDRRNNVMNFPSISIIIPTYNVAPYIQKCLESVAAQTYTGSIECLIVDDCGPDNSIHIAEKFIREYQSIIHKPSSINFKIIHREKNGGLSAARNSGIREAKGEYLYFLDADDIVFPHTISTLVSLAEKYPGVNMVQGNCEVQGNSGLSYLHYDEAKFFPYYQGVEAEEFLILKCPPTAWNKLIKRDIIIDNNLYFVEGILHEDEMWRWDIHHFVKSIALSYENTYWYRMNNDTSIMATKDFTKSILSKVEIIKRMIMTLDKTIPYDCLFLFEFASPSVKSKFWLKVSDKYKASQKIQELLRDKRLYALPWFIRFQIRQWSWPAWVVQNKIFVKLCFEFETKIKKMLIK